MERGVRGPARPLSFWGLVFGFLLVCMFHIAGLRASSSSVTTESPNIARVTAVTGGDAALPCDTRSPQPNDALVLVVWYKDEIPIYSYDARVTGPTAHWVDDISLAGRARWHSTTPSSLRLRDVIPSDRSIYRCRADFRVSPTINQRIILDVIELPEKPKIFDEFDKEVIGVAGPYVENTSTKLTCAVSGGKPAPRLRWWRNDQVVSTLPPNDDGSRLSFLELRIQKLTREYNEAVYTCTADNTALVPPLRVNVQIQLYLTPLSVELLTREQPLSVEQKAELACRSAGARPPAIIKWWLDNKEMSNAVQKVSDDRNETLSILQWTPRMENNGMTLRCQASHTILEHAVLETSMKLDLHYVPIVVLELGSKLNPNDIEEGDDVYFDCVVRANPPAYKVVWEHNGQIMSHSQRAGVIATSTHLALQGVSREQAGKYSCTASNVEGDGKSLPLNLQVIYKPVCKLATTAIVGAAINEPARVTCEVDAFPPPQAFQWTLNNSIGTVEMEVYTIYDLNKAVLKGKLLMHGSGYTVVPMQILVVSKMRTNGNNMPERFSRTAVYPTDVKRIVHQDKITVEDGRSILSITPTSEADYGTLACRATNLAGQQLEACRYTLLPAVKPDRPFNCSTLNLTDDSAELRCVAGYDGGLHTVYFVEAWEAGNLLLNVSTASPVWKLRGLGSGKALKLVFYAYNARGKSESTILRVHTLSRLALHTEEKAANGGVDVNWVLGIISGVAGTLIVVIIVVMLAKKRQHHPVEYVAPSQTMKTYKTTINNGNHSPLQSDDKNPDVVPLGKDLNYSRDSERPPDPPPYGAVVSPLVGLSRSAHSLQQHEVRSVHTPNTPASDAQSIGTLADDRRSVTSGTLSRRREVVTTRTPLLANARESCV